MANKAGPGGISLKHVIDRVTAERRLCIELEDLEQVPLAHMELTRAEAVSFYKSVGEAIQQIWPNTNLTA